MTIVHTLDKVAEWLRDNVCADVNLKPRSPDKDTDEFEYELVHPSVFALYVPTSSTKPPAVKATTPAICVQLIDGSDQMSAHRRTLKLRLTFSAWDPGIHGPDVFAPIDEDASGPGPAYERLESGEFRLTHTGWRDVWNFVDVALRTIETSRSLGGYPLDPSTPVKFGSYDEDGAIADYYPFWFAWVELAINQEVIVADPALENLL